MRRVQSDGLRCFLIKQTKDAGWSKVVDGDDFGNAFAGMQPLRPEEKRLAFDAGI